MNYYYSNEIQVQLLVSLLKQFNIKYIVASPGSTNINLVASLQQDSFFKVFSSVDERSAAYMACGMAYELGQPVALSCTGATASRNYLPAITEAYYRKLPVIAITSTQDTNKVGHHVAQVIDRSQNPKDTYKFSVDLPLVNNSSDSWHCNVLINKALLELSRNGGGPVHINLPTTYDREYSTENLPTARKISRFTNNQYRNFPDLDKRVSIVLGSHREFSDEETIAIDNFCAYNDSIVFCDHTSSYKGNYRVNFSLVASQDFLDTFSFNADISIHLGEITGDYSMHRLVGKEVWRVNPDGELRDPFQRLTNIFQMDELDFFQFYTDDTSARKTSQYDFYKNQVNDFLEMIPDLPFGNIWAAKQLAPILPANSVIHFGILNSLRSWNFFELPEGVDSTCNVGGFGIDGCTSSAVGASLTNIRSLYFLVTGDLAFFYDINALGNRHISSNLRIILVNNGTGIEFKNYKAPAYDLGDDVDSYISATGHFGNQSRDLVKHFAQSLNFTYLSASNKEEFENCQPLFLDVESDKPVILELFVQGKEEDEALSLIRQMHKTYQSSAKTVLKNMLGTRTARKLKKVIQKFK